MLDHDLADSGFCSGSSSIPLPSMGCYDPEPFPGCQGYGHVFNLTVTPGNLVHLLLWCSIVAIPVLAGLGGLRADFRPSSSILSTTRSYPARLPIKCESNDHSPYYSTLHDKQTDSFTVPWVKSLDIRQLCKLSSAELHRREPMSSVRNW